jgi:hypothetical protein
VEVEGAWNFTAEDKTSGRETILATKGLRKRLVPELVALIRSKR